MAVLPPDADRVLAEDAKGLARLRRVLHGPAGPAPDRPLPTREERFGRPSDPDRPREPDGSAPRRRETCPG